MPRRSLKSTTIRTRDGFNCGGGGRKTYAGHRRAMRRDAHDAGGDLSTAFFGLNRATTLAWLLAWHQLRPLDLVLAACQEHRRVEHQCHLEPPMASAMSTAPQRPAPSCSFAFRARVPAFDIGNCTFRHGPFHLNINHILSHHTTPYIQPPPNNAQASLGRRTRMQQVGSCRQR